MVFEACVFAVLGLAVAAVVHRLLARRLPSTALVYATGAAAALLGGLLARTVLGPGHLAAGAAGSVVVAAVLLSLLVRPAQHGRHSRPRSSSPGSSSSPHPA
jgi:ABC-type enterochelin transport system permease subunit